MSDALRLLGFGLGYVAVFSALGIGPVMWLARGIRGGVLLAPIAGFAMAAAVLTSAAVVMPMRVAAWAVLLPGAVVSMAVAVRLARRRRSMKPDGAEIAVPTTLGLVGLLLAILPGLLRGTVGPVSLAIYDAWGYIQADLWLRDHTLGDTPPLKGGVPDLTAAYGWASTQGGVRIGVSTISAAVTTLFRTTPDQTNLALLGALFALLPLSFWVTARMLGAGRPAATLGAAFALSPALLMLVADSTLGNLAALTLVAPALALGARGLARADWRTSILAGLLGAGLIAVYPEFLLPAVLVGAIGFVATVVHGLVGQARRPRIRLPSALAQPLLAVGIAVVTAPVGLARAHEYLLSRSGDGPWDASLPARFLTSQDGLAWAFGVMHLYELQRFAQLDSVETAAAILVPALLAAALGLGIVTAGARRAMFVLVPVCVSILLGLFARDRFQHGQCDYCLWKALTFMLPFLAVGLAVGVSQLWRRLRGTGLTTRLGQVALALVALGGVAAVGRSDAALTRAQDVSPAAVPRTLRDVASAESRLARPATIFVEAMDSTAAPAYLTPAAYVLARGVPNVNVSIDAAGVASSYLGAPQSPDRYYSPAYRYVLTALPGVRSGRRPVAAEGPFALLRRAPIDVGIARTGYAVDAADGAGAIAWVQAPFELWIASPKAGRIALSISIRRAPGQNGVLAVARGGSVLPVVTSGRGAVTCAQLAVSAGRTVVQVIPRLDPVPAPPSRATETDPFPPPPKQIGIEALHARLGRCPPARADLPAAAFGAGWFAPESGGPTGVFRWMGARAVLEVGRPGVVRPACSLSVGVTSLVSRRALEIRLGGSAIGRVSEVPGGFSFRDFTVRIPAGNGVARLVLVPHPGAGPASAVTPGDPRRLSVALSTPVIERP